MAKKTSTKSTKPSRPQLKKQNAKAEKITKQKNDFQSVSSVVEEIKETTPAWKVESNRRLINDALWLLATLVVAYVVIALLSFRMSDPAWSRGVIRGDSVANFGGLFGAYLADVAYYLFGLSVWWIVVVLALMLYRHFRPIAEKGIQPYDPVVGSIGLVILLICGPVFEVYCLGSWLKDSLPLGAGGLMGMLLFSGVAKFLGTTVSGLISLAMSCLAFSLLLQVSWLDLLEKIGGRLEKWVVWLTRLGMQPTKSDMSDERQQLQNVDMEGAKTKFVDTTKEQVDIPKPNWSTSNRKFTVNVAPVVKNNRRAVSSFNVGNGHYALPDLGCLRTPTAEPIIVDDNELRATAALIESKLLEFGIEVQVVTATAGPVITRFEIEPAKGVKGSQIVNLSKDLARALSIQSVRVVETIPGKNTMGIELPNVHRQEVLLQEILTADVFAEAKSKLTVALGKDIAGMPVVGDLAKMPHLLVGGMTGSGKSVGVNAMIMSILYKATPDEVRFIMIDPKMLELSVYDGIAHLLCPVITDMKEAGHALNWCVAEMEKRYRLLSHLGVRNLAGYNEKIQTAKANEKHIPNPFSLNPDDPEPLEKLPQIVVVVDELADLMMTEKKSVETQIARLAQKARAAGIHMIIATQRPSVDVITGLIKANVPTRMAFTVQSRIDSRTILDQMGAEDLLKYGDLLFLQPGEAEPTRLQGAFVSDDEVHQVVKFVKSQAEPNYVEGILTGEAALETTSVVNPEAVSDKDELFDQAVQFIISSQKTSISALQRHLRIGYNRAANLMQSLEEAGVVSSGEMDGKRQILVRTTDS